MPPKKKKVKEKKKKEEKVPQDIAEDITEKTDEETSEEISKKKVVYIEIDDEVTVVYDRLKSVRSKHVYIVAPKRAILFQSVVNLKILKRKADEDGKTIYLITNDSNGIHLAQKVGITVYNKSNGDGSPALFSTELSDERLRITPLRATVNSVEEATPTRLKERKISISEILRSRRNGGKGGVIVSKIARKAREKKKKKNSRLVIVSPNRHALIGLICVSMVILLFIVYIALPGVTIYLTPSASVLEKSVNITLADFNQNRAELDTHPVHMIGSYEVETTVNISLTQASTGKKFSNDAKNASGVITVYNSTENEWPLVATTRFQTEDGLIFRIPAAVTVPPASSSGPGSAEAFVKADAYDVNGLIVGERGNIGPSTFFLPGLKESSRSNLYAENFADMTGGFSDYTSFVSAEDIESSKSRINDELLKSAVEELELIVADRTELAGGDISYELLKGDQAIKFGEVSTVIPPDLENKSVGEFSVNGSVKVTGVYYDKDEMLTILMDELKLKKSPQKELVRVNEDSTTYRIFEWDDVGSKIKLTANIKGIEQYEIDVDKENGARLLDKIKSHILGKNTEDAKTYIQNLPEVNKVEIDSWPIWSPTIPKVADNIDFEVRDAITVD
jgi:hypothetical protein